MSMKKIWEYPLINNELKSIYVNKYNISEVLAKILIARNIKETEIEDFLNPDIKKLNDPFLLNDMEKVVKKIIEARDNKEKIAIYGDYDVDGITSITILYTFLKELGIEVSYYLPDRLEEGYGLNEVALNKLKEKGVTLIITVDCGISALEEVNIANKLGIQVIITDHHECGEILPNAFAIINAKMQNSKYPYYNLAGVGTTFKLISAIAIYLNMENIEYLKYMDLVALGTIADIVPLLEENRIITYNGLKLLNNTNNQGLKALIKLANISDVTSEAVSFALAPRINASGRMADATVAVKLLLAKDEIEAYKYARILDSQNAERQRIEKNIYEEAIKAIEENDMINKKTIVLESSTWHPGVIGIVASKLMDRYLKPVILFAIDKDAMIAKGSGRIPQGKVSIYAALSKCSNLLSSYGGHELAAGLTVKVEALKEFKTMFEQIINKMSNDEFISVIDIDAELNEDEVSIKTVEEIKMLAPFGQKNKIPTFSAQNLKVTSISTLKDKHLKLKLRGTAEEIDGIFFKGAYRRDELVIGDKINICFNLSVNEYMNQRKIQYIIQDFKKSM